MKGRSGIPLFLIELIVMLCVFITAASIDTLMLVRAKNMSQSSSDLNRAVEYAVSAAECYKRTGGGRAAGMEYSDGKWTAYYDGGWQKSDGPGEYSVTMTVSGGKADIIVANGGGSIYTLTAKAAEYEK